MEIDVVLNEEWWDKHPVQEIEKGNEQNGWKK